MLYPLLFIYTIAYFGLLIWDFVARQSFEMPSGLMAVYIALVVAYAGDKEIRRWMGRELPSRKGAIFVYLWFLFYLVAFVAHSFKPEYALPKDLSVVALQVLGIFFGSKASKKIHETKVERSITPSPQPSPTLRQISGQARGEGENIDPEKVILDLLRQKGQAKRADLMPYGGGRENRAGWRAKSQFLHRKTVLKFMAHV